jgi:hypothetical protein
MVDTTLVIKRHTDSYSDPSPKCGGDGAQYETKRDGIVPPKRFVKVELREYNENDERDYFLNDFQLIAAELAKTHPIRGYLKTILPKRDQPAEHYGDSERRRAVLEMSIPRERHERVRDEEQQHSEHVVS